MNNNCVLVNISWIDRGIKLAIIYYILKYYNILKYKNIIIDNDNYRHIIQILFPNLSIIKYDKNNIKSNYFFFNIRKIHNKKNIIIDYLKNYNTYISTNKIGLIPWYDMNDPLIVYEYNKKKK